MERLFASHTNFKYGRYDDSGIELRRILQEAFGDTHPYEPYHLRTWITFPDGNFYIRNDLIDDAPSFVTFLLLKTQ